MANGFMGCELLNESSNVYGDDLNLPLAIASLMIALNGSVQYDEQQVWM